MSKIAITGGATGTGVFSVVAPSTSTDRTLTLPDSTGTMATAESTLAQFNATGAAPVYACRAWVNFNGTGTVAIRASGNVSSITDRGVGKYTVNFAIALNDANYATLVTGQKDAIDDGYILGGIGSGGYTTSSVQVTMQIGSGGPDDTPTVCVSVFL
jgi:phage tail sheath gpL-like